MKKATRKGPEANDKTETKEPPSLINYPNVVFDVLNSSTIGICCGSILSLV